MIENSDIYCVVKVMQWKVQNRAAMKMGSGGCLLAVVAIAGVVLASASTADVAFYDQGFNCADIPLHTSHNITTESCHSFSGLGIYVKCEYAGSWTAYIFQDYQTCIYGTDSPQYVDSDAFFHGASKEECASGHHGSLSHSDPTYNLKVACRYDQHQTDGHIAFKVYSNPGVHVGCNNKPIAETMYIENGGCINDLFHDISFNVTCEQVNDAFSPWKLSVFNSSDCKSGHLPYDTVGFSPNCTAFSDPQHYINSVIHAEVYCDRGTIPKDFFVMSWKTFQYNGGSGNGTCTDSDDYNTTMDNSFNGQCLHGLTWKLDNKSEIAVSARVSCAGHYEGAPWYMYVYDSHECEQGPRIDEIYSGMHSGITCHDALQSRYMHVEVNCGGPIPKYISWKGFNETYNEEEKCEGEPALIDDSYLTGDCSIHYFGTQKKLYGFQAFCLYREDGWVMQVWNNTECVGQPFGILHYPSFGAPPPEKVNKTCSGGHFEEYIADIQVSVDCSGPVPYPGHDTEGAISWDLWFEHEPDAEGEPCKTGNSIVSVKNYTNAMCHGAIDTEHDNTPYSTLVYCKDNSRYALGLKNVGEGDSCVEKNFTPTMLLWYEDRWTLEHWYGVSNCSGFPTEVIRGYDATCTASRVNPGFQATVRCNGPKEPEHIIYNWKLWINTTECEGDPVVQQDIYNNTECYTVYVKEDDKNTSYSHQVYCDSASKESDWEMNIFQGDTCVGAPIDVIKSSDNKTQTCSKSEKTTTTSAEVDCSGKGDWAISWKLWVDEEGKDHNATEHCVGPHLSNYYYRANTCQRLNFTRLYDYFSAQSYEINCVSREEDSGYTVVFYNDPICLKPAHVLYYDGRYDPTCVSSHDHDSWWLHVGVNCSAKNPDLFGIEATVEYKYGAKLPEAAKDKADVCGVTSTIAEGLVTTHDCHTDLGFHNTYSLKVFCEEESENSRWSLLLYDGTTCQGDPVAAFEGGGGKSNKEQCGFNLLGDSLNVAEVNCKPKKHGKKTNALSKGGKIGLGIFGVIVGLALIILLVFFGLRAWRKRQDRYDSETVYRPLTTPIAEMPMGAKS